VQLLVLHMGDGRIVESSAALEWGGGESHGIGRVGGSVLGAGPSLKDMNPSFSLRVYLT
jgi:hypothetical protein